MKKLITILLCFGSMYSATAQTEITEKEIYNHILFLTSQNGRYPGGVENKRVVRYIRKEFKKLGLINKTINYTQKFKTKLRLDKSKKQKDVKTWNVVGFLEGNDPVLKNEYIVLGAHYDHLGLGGILSKSDNKNTIHFGADDNASGTAALLEIAEKLVSQKGSLKRSIIFIAFGAEEQGLVGSRYFVENPPVPLSKIKLMLNMDMVGRLNKENHIYMGGAGTFPGGVALMKSLGDSFNLTPIVHAGSVGGSDHVAFYKKKISVLGLHTGGHPQYHTPEDTIDLINLNGEKRVCDYIFTAILKLASSSEELYFINQE